MSAPVVTTTSGKVRGVVASGVSRFYGVPYAAAPTGENRFKLPVPHPGWNGERDATRKGPNAPQTSRAVTGLDMTPVVGDGWHKGDEYLTANIWTPDPGAKRLPVMVFIHGGAWVGGTSDCPAYDCTSFARNGIVGITVSYRMSVEGFMPAEGIPPNLGLHDMIAALRWVQHNAESFGGDPGNITVFGESAGAMSIANLVASPLTRGLFRRAIVQSGHGSMLRRERSAQMVANKIAELLGVEPTLQGLGSKSLEDCVKAVEGILQPDPNFDMREANGTDPTFGIGRFLPFVGDSVLPEPTLDALAKGAGKDVELLIGSNLEEMNLYFVPANVIAIDDPAMAAFFINRMTPRGAEILQDYGLGKGGKPGVVLAAALTDLVFRDPSRLYAETHQGRSHVYEFGWRSGAFDGRLGACHALELPFVFNTLPACTGPQGLCGESPSQELADHIHKIWLRFATDGTLPWAPFDKETRQVYRLDKAAAAREETLPAAKYRVPV